MSKEYLEQERSSDTKTFSVNNNLVNTKSAEMLYRQYPDYVESNQLHKACIVYAAAYSETMLTRA